jgi:hypothetical protein
MLLSVGPSFLKLLGHTADLGGKSAESTSGKSSVSSRTLGDAKLDKWARSPIVLLQKSKSPLLNRN